MKLSTVFLSGLLIATQLIASDASQGGVYYAEFKALKDAPKTTGLFKQDVDGGSHTTQCNLLSYQSKEFFSDWDGWRRALSLGNIKRQIMMGKELSFIDTVLIHQLCGQNDDLIIVTHETMPALYDYVCSLSKETKIATPLVFVTLREGFFSAFSRKILAFKGSIVIGQQLLHDISDTELEALVAQEIGHIKYNHMNKELAATGLIAVVASLASLVKEPRGGIVINQTRLGCCLVALLPLVLLFSKRFEKQADAFVSEEADKANGFINFYERLQQRDQARVTEFDEISTMLTDNSSEISVLLYLRLLAFYYMAKAEHCVTKVYNKFMYPTHQERINTAKAYLAQQEA